MIEILPYAVGIIGSLIGVVWAMLNGKIAEQKREMEVMRGHVAKLFEKLEQARERCDEMHLKTMLEIYKK